MSNINFYQFDKITKFIDYRGKTPKKTEHGVPLITAKNIKFGYLSEEPKEYISEDDYESWMTRGIPKKGDVLFTTEAPLGNVCILDTNEKRAFAQRAIILQPIDETVYLSKYLFYYLMSPIFKDELDSKKTGTTVKGIKSTVLKKFQISLPSLLKQQRVVLKLDKLFEKIDKAIILHQKNIDLIDTFMGSVLSDVFEEMEEKYGKTPISDVMKVSNKTLIPNDNEVYNYVALENIQSHNGKLVDFSPTIGSEIKSSKVIFEKDMVLYGKLRPYLNKVWISDFDGVATTEILPFYPLDKNILDMNYVKYYFLSPLYLSKVMNNCSGARMPRLTTKFIKSDEAYIPLSSISIQRRTVKYLDEVLEKIEKVKSVQKEKMKNLEALKISILDKAFKGEL